MFGTMENHSLDGGRHKNEGMRMESSSASYCKLLHREREHDSEVQRILDLELD